jgi:ADP-heptose:LPS heptosyltransferase
MKILIIRFSSIGDIVLTSPVIRCVRKKYPDSEIHFLTKKEFSELVSCNANINEVRFLNDSFLQTVAEVRKQQYDLIIDLHKNTRTLLIRAFAGVKSISFDKLNFEKWLIVNFKINRLPKMHLVDRYFDGLRKMGVENDGEGLEYFLKEHDKELISNFDFSSEYFMVWAIGAKQKTKQFPAQKIAETLLLPEFKNKTVVLIGGKKDVQNAKLICDLVKSNQLFDMTGKLTIGQSAALINKSQVLISNDTGMMHIAAALKKKTISIWGNTTPDFGMYPFYGNTNVQHKFIETVEMLDCRPCSKLGFDECPKGHFKCMNSIDNAKISEALLRFH